MSDFQQPTSTRPYLLRALYEWCTDNGFTPHVAVAVDDSVVVPREFVQDGQIVLNIGMDSTNALRIDNDALAFQARFGGVARDLYVPVGRVIALFARENGQGMTFQPEETPEHTSVGKTDQVESEAFEDASPELIQPPLSGKPALRLVK